MNRRTAAVVAGLGAAILGAGHVAADPPPVCQDPALVQLEADYIAAAQYVNSKDNASGAINTIAGPPTAVVPRESAFAILGLLRAADCLANAAYRTRAQNAMEYLLRVQDQQGGWFDQYRYEKPSLRSESASQAAAVMIALNELGFAKKRFGAMVKAGEFLLSMQDPLHKTGADDGLVGAGLDDRGRYLTSRTAVDNALAYQAFKAAARWARIMKVVPHEQRFEDAAARVLDGINDVLNDPATPVWYSAVDAQGHSLTTQHDASNYSPQLFDVPADGAGAAAVGEWIVQTLVHQPEGGAVWNDGPQNNRLSPGYSFQACLVWIDLHQFVPYDAARAWANGSGLHQTTPDANGVRGGWIDWKETAGAQAQPWERFIGASAFSILAATDGFDFSAE